MKKNENHEIPNACVCVCVCLACHVSVLSCPHRQLLDQVLMFPTQTHKSPSIKYSQTYLIAYRVSMMLYFFMVKVTCIKSVHKCAWTGFNQSAKEGR